MRMRTKPSGMARKSVASTAAPSSTCEAARFGTPNTSSSVGMPGDAFTRCRSIWTSTGPGCGSCEISRWKSRGGVSKGPPRAPAAASNSQVYVQNSLCRSKRRIAPSTVTRWWRAFSAGAGRLRLAQNSASSRAACAAWPASVT